MRTPSTLPRPRLAAEGRQPAQPQGVIGSAHCANRTIVALPSRRDGPSGTGYDLPVVPRPRRMGIRLLTVTEIGNERVD
jgi:4'-phosphopantetheinyl transferase EntD